MTSGDGLPDDAEYSGVGYRKPPRATRFTRGQSGNPAGRPRGRHRETPYEAVLALQLLCWDRSESMGNHDSDVVDASSVD
jgi:Family of unknown function (DUF5681)